MNEQLLKRCTDFAAHLSALTGVDGCVLNTSDVTLIWPDDSPRFCENCTHKKCRAASTCLYGVSEAGRWDGRYVYYCPLGLVFAAAAVMEDGGSVAGGIVMGPVVMGEPQDTVSELPEADMAEKVASLPQMDPSRMRHLSHVLKSGAEAAAGCVTGHVEGILRYEQDKLLSAIYSARDRLTSGRWENAYPIEYEKQLRQTVIAGDKQGAQRLLNELLGHIYCSDDFDLDRIRPRVIELIVVLSRASIDAGADSREIFLYNDAYMQQINKFSDIEELSVWITGVMHRFIQHSFDFAQIKHSDVVFKAMEYIRQNYDRKLSLDDIAQHVYLSRSYLSSLFREEAGQTLFSYINQVRVEKSKLFLMDSSVSLAEAAALCGFEDQSYFTKVFRKITGLSPKQYRDRSTAK